MSDSAFTAAQREAFRCVLDAIVPRSADGALPGASELGLADAIEQKLGGMRPLIARGLDALDARARERGAGAFAALTDADRELVLNEYSAADPGFLPGLVFQTYCAYYQSARVVSALGVEPRPPYPLGYPLEQPDLDALLEPVRAREKLYREV